MQFILKYFSIIFVHSSKKIPYFASNSTLEKEYLWVTRVNERLVYDVIAKRKIASH